MFRTQSCEEPDHRRGRRGRKQHWRAAPDLSCAPPSICSAACLSATSSLSLRAGALEEPLLPPPLSVPRHRSGSQLLGTAEAWRYNMLYLTVSVRTTAIPKKEAASTGPGSQNSLLGHDSCQAPLIPGLPSVFLTAGLCSHVRSHRPLAAFSLQCKKEHVCFLPPSALGKSV